ncbi:MAG: ABC transporter permease [Lewinellaceae bacterium]|nr:ABC transporter permease [Saprospiraceae bacterium]MCB9312102.1 ABC transporter permease [Lewinellaceae bacterium]HRW76306.1 ABC transporter permease [Saprospiraceae bacterium]
MSEFWTYVIKEFKHILRDRRTLFVLLGIPIAQILLFGFALTNEVKNSKFAVLDLSKDEQTRLITERLAASQFFDLAEHLTSYDQIERSFQAGHSNLVVVFPAGFGRDLEQSHHAQVQLVADASDPNLGSTLINYASAIIQDVQMELWDDQPLPYSIHTEVRMLYNPQLKGAFNFVPGVMAMVMMLICAMMTSIAIVREKEQGNMEVLLVSPLKPMVLILAKTVPYLALSLVNLTTILLLSVTLLELPIAGNLLLLYAESGLFIMTALALGMLISTSTNSQMMAMFISLVGLLLPTLMFSGFMFPIENMPLPLQVLSNLVPAKWYYLIVKDVMIKGLGFMSIWKETLILLGMTVFLFVLSWRKFDIRLT